MHQKFVTYLSISLVFFSFPVAMFFLLQHIEIPWFGSNLYAAVFFLFGTFSFFGSALFLES